MTALAPPPLFTPPRRFHNAAEWLDSLGGVPLERIIFDPWPGTATEADLLRLVERDKRLCELIDGTLVEKPVGAWESMIAINLASKLHHFAASQNLGVVFGADATLRMRGGQVRLPDVSFVSMQRLPRTADPIPTLPPDLAVEVVSRGNRDSEIQKKLREYFESGVRLVWIVDPETRTVAVYRDAGAPMRLLDEQQMLDGEDVLAGFTAPIADLCAGVPRAEP